MSHESIEMRTFELLADRSQHVSELAVELRRQVSAKASDASELLYSGYAVSIVFSFTHRLREAFIHIAVYSGHVNLGFNQGSRLPDPDSLLQGSGKRIRHVRINSIEDLAQPPIAKLIDAAIQDGKEMAEQASGIKPATFIDKSG